MPVSTFGPGISNNWQTSGSNVPNGIGGYPELYAWYTLMNAALGWQGAARTSVGWGQNMGTGRVVSANGDLYVYAVSESESVPILRWHIANLASIHELAVTGPIGSSVKLDQVITKAIFTTGPPRRRGEERREERRERRPN